MQTDIDTTEYTVDELMQLWQQGDLTVDEGTVQDIDQETLEVAFEGQQETLFVTYGLSENVTTRTDESGHFNILAADPDVEQKPLPIRDGGE
jgi:hypothetical protein